MEAFLTNPIFLVALIVLILVVGHGMRYGNGVLMMLMTGWMSKIGY